MGSFKGHIVPGTLFLVVGLWHMWCTVYRYVTNPEKFRIRVWNPVPGFGGRLRYLELYIVVVGVFVDLCIELVYSPHLKYFVNGILNPNHMNNFEHSGMLIMFFIFGLVALISAKTSLLPLPDGALCMINATAFASEYLLFYFHSTNHKGLEGYYHFILVLLIGLCLLTIVLGALIPSSFPLDLCYGMGMAFQGLWFYQTAFTLYGPMMPNGCHLKGNEITCLSEDNLIRGELLANFQQFSIVVGVFVLVSVSYGFANSRFGRVWNPAPGFGGRLIYLELYIVVVGVFVDSCIELVYSPHLKYVVNGILNPNHMNNFEHSGMLIMFFIFGLVALVSAKTS